MRYLKPSFFTDGELAELPALHRLAFQGLWCLADKDGRLEEKPRELKIQILPYDDCDFERILADLAKPKGDGPGFIRRYRSGARRYISITRWKDHQKPHPDEKSKALPEPPSWEPLGDHEATSGQPVVDQYSATGQQGGDGDGDGDSNGDGDSAVAAGAAPAQSPLFALAPKPKGKPSGTQKSNSAATEQTLQGTVEDLQSVWNELPAPFPRWTETPKKRRQKALARLRERPIAGPGGWREVIARIGASRFLREGKPNDPWTAGVDFLLKPDTAAKVLEGNYDDRTPRTRATGPPAPSLDLGPCHFAGCEREAEAEWFGHPYCYPHGARIAAGEEDNAA